ncbi:hypothetical protein AAVH_18858 [Aphelenchoides avenae]|nr:hypothetical protein AAVH_18858 [Aphelenchus avenae]
MAEKSSLESADVLPESGKSFEFNQLHNRFKTIFCDSRDEFPGQLYFRVSRKVVINGDFGFAIAADHLQQCTAFEHSERSARVDAPIFLSNHMRAPNDRRVLKEVVDKDT